MNILHMKYAVEVARIGSINKAAQDLYIAQPNLSRCIKELEADLGIVIFDRTSKGMHLTPDGEIFIRYATKVLNQIDEIEKMYRDRSHSKQRFSISVPRASYISEAFARFTTKAGDDALEYYYMETNPLTAINNIVNLDYKLAIIRIASSYSKYYKDLVEEKNLDYEILAEFSYVLVMNRKSPIASLPEIRQRDLRSLIEIVHGDPYVPSLPLSVVKKEELHEEVDRRLIMFDRASPFEVLSENPDAYMWVSPIPDGKLARYGLIQRKCLDYNRVYKDILIRRKDYTLSDLDQQFLDEVSESMNKCLRKDFK